MILLLQHNIMCLNTGWMAGLTGSKQQRNEAAKGKKKRVSN